MKSTVISGKYIHWRVLTGTKNEIQIKIHVSYDNSDYLISTLVEQETPEILTDYYFSLF